MLGRLRATLCIMLLLGLGMAIPVARAEDAVVPRWEKAKCKFDVPAKYKIVCGYLIVPEDHNDPTGPTIKLHFAIFAARSKKPLPDPIIYLEGGPGGHSLERAKDFMEGPFNLFAEQHDFIMFDHRGVGFSEPALSCPEVTK